MFMLSNDASPAFVCRGVRHKRKPQLSRLAPVVLLGVGSAGQIPRWAVVLYPITMTIRYVTPQMADVKDCNVHTRLQWSLDMVLCVAAHVFWKIQEVANRPQRLRRCLFTQQIRTFCVPELGSAERPCLLARFQNEA